MRNGCEILFISTDSENPKEIMEKILGSESFSCVYLEENPHIEEGEIFYIKDVKDERIGKAHINSISSLTDGMMHSLSKVSDMLVVPNQYLKDKNFHERLSLSCWMYFVYTCIVVPKNMELKEKIRIRKNINNKKINPQFDITPDSTDIKREFKIRKKHIHGPIFEMSLTMISWVVGIPFGVLGLLVGGMTIAGDGVYSGIRYLSHKRKETRIIKKNNK